MIFYSIIIPVYNAERYLTVCLTSLLNLSSNNIEIICVNDGSTDNSLSILRAFAAKDSRFIVLDQQNKGVSVARNMGLKMAKGEYVGFVDADDFVSAHYFETLYSLAKEHLVDIIISDFYVQKNEKNQIQRLPFSKNKKFSKNDIEEIIYPLMISSDILNALWNKFFKAEIIRNHQIEFPVGITNGEDAFFVIKYLVNSQSVLFTDFAGYCYRELEGSATRDIINKDYLKIALQHYQFDYKNDLGISLPESDISKYKNVRLVNNLLALISIYYQSGLSEIKKFKKVKSIVNNEILQFALREHWDDIVKNQSRFSIFLLNQMRLKNMFFIILACKYANFRNSNQL